MLEGIVRVSGSANIGAVERRASRLIRDARRQAGISQAELARRAGVSRSVVNAYERGTRQPSVAALERLVAAAGLRLALAPSRPDPVSAGEQLLDVLELADRLPNRRQSDLTFPPIAGGPRRRR